MNVQRRAKQSATREFGAGDLPVDLRAIEPYTLRWEESARDWVLEWEHGCLPMRIYERGWEKEAHQALRIFVYLWKTGVSVEFARDLAADYVFVRAKRRDW